MNPSDFIAKLAPIAAANMREHGVPASLTIAQAILESGWGTSRAAQQANNLFGMKGIGPGGSVTLQTTEYSGGEAYTTTAQFRKYNSWGESIEDHTKLILNGSRSQPDRYHGVLWADYKTAAYAVWKGGYATDPAYPQKLISLIEKYSLHQYDMNKEEEELKVEQLSAEVIKLQTRIEQLESTLKVLQQAQNQPQVPKWAEQAVEAAIRRGILQDTKGSYDFYRILTILHRLELLKPKKD